MPRTFAICFVHDVKPDKYTPDKCTNRISAHDWQAPYATFVWNCDRISAQRDDDPPKCHSKPPARDMLYNETMSMSIKALISRTKERGRAGGLVLRYVCCQCCSKKGFRLFQMTVVFFLILML